MDDDGSLTGMAAGSKVLPKTDTLPSASCVDASDFR